MSASVIINTLEAEKNFINLHLNREIFRDTIPALYLFIWIYDAKWINIHLEQVNKL